MLNEKSRKKTFALLTGLLFCLALLISACTTEPTPPTGGGDATPTAPQGGGSAVVYTATVDVKGTQKTVLTDAQGATLYYFTPDTAAKVACTGNCAANWPPLLYTGSGTPTSNSSLPGTLSTQANANGNQVLYNGHYLYTYAEDSAPGQANGEGIGGKWYVATPDLQ